MIFFYSYYLLCINKTIHVPQNNQEQQLENHCTILKMVDIFFYPAMILFTIKCKGSKGELFSYIE